jgi:hypothetical protein
MQIHSVGIDLGKTTFHLVALGAAGKVLRRGSRNLPLMFRSPVSRPGHRIKNATAIPLTPI